jgi:hypothetical protein
MICLLFAEPFTERFESKSVMSSPVAALRTYAVALNGQPQVLDASIV